MLLKNVSVAQKTSEPALRGITLTKSLSAYQEYGLDIFLRQSWTDPRLDHGLRGTLSLSNTIISQIWLPDSYFKNAKGASFHDVTTPNMMITIGPGGLVNYNARCVPSRWRVPLIHQITNSVVLSHLARRTRDISLLCSAEESRSLLGAKRFAFSTLHRSSFPHHLTLRLLLFFSLSPYFIRSISSWIISGISTRMLFIKHQIMNRYL